MTHLEELIRDGAIQPDFTWTIEGINEKLEQETFEMTSQAFTWNEYPVSARAKLECGQDSWVYMSMCLENNHQDKHGIDIEPIPDVYYVLRDRSGSWNPEHKFSRSRCSFGTTFDQSLTFRILLNFSTDRLYLVEDSVVVEIYVEPPSMVQRVGSYTGSLVGAIDNYRLMKRMPEDGPIYHRTPYFYTGPRGYRVQAEMWLELRKKFNERWLMAKVTCLNGRFDSHLPSAFPHQTTVTLMNRKEPNKNVEMKIIENQWEFLAYSFGVCNDEAIENVVDNGTIFYTITINRLDRAKKSHCVLL